MVQYLSLDLSFCNAGFDLFGNSLASFADDTYVLFIIAVLIIAGSFGFWFGVIYCFIEKASVVAAYLTGTVDWRYYPAVIIDELSFD